VLTLLLVAGSLGMDNFAASIAIGLAGVDRALRVRIACAFGLFEAAMPVIGLLLGRQLSGSLGAQAPLVGGLALALAGAYAIIQAIRSADEPPATRAGAGAGRLLLLGAALSIDNLVVGFALGAYHSPLALGIALIAGVSVGLSLVGLELGARLGSSVEHSSQLLGGIVLVCVGAAIATQLL
jgi:putative Mn2+ efflux pump MntP